MPKLNLGGILGKNSPTEELRKPTQELAKSVTETSSKIREPKTYNEAINDYVNKNKWQEAINKEL